MGQITEEVGASVCVRLMVYVPPLTGRSQSERYPGNDYSLLAFLMPFPQMPIISNSQM